MILKFLLIIFLKQYIYSYLKIPFKISEIESIEDIFFTEYHSELNIGTPNQKIICDISFSSNHLLIPSNKINNKLFNNNNSKTFKFENQKKENFYYSNIQLSGFYSNDTFTFLNEKNEKISDTFSFLFLENAPLEFKKNTGIISLRPKNYFSKSNLIYELKSKNLINSYEFFLYYKNKTNGYLIIGAFPHEIISNYKINELNIINAEIFKSNLQWFIYIDNIYYENYNIKGGIILSLNLKGLVSDYDFEVYINKTFFNKYFENGICKSTIISLDKNYDYMIYFCDKKISLKNFKTINFYSKLLNYTFTFNSNELFQEFNNNLYFKIIFNMRKNSKQNNWVMGELFLKKYQYSLNLDKGTFSIYIKENKKSNIFVILIMLLLVIIMVFILIFYFKNLLIKKKLKAEELEVILDYNKKE